MKHRLIRLLAITLILAPLAASIIHPEHASASGEDYLLYYNSGNFSSGSQVGYSQSSVYARDGVYGQGNLVTLSPATSSGTNNRTANIDAKNILNRWSGTYSASNRGVYLGQYQCKGTTIYEMIGLTESMEPNSNGNTSQATVASNIWVIGSAKGNQSYNGATTKLNFKDCMPGGISVYPNDINSPHNVPLPSYFSGITQAKAQDWYSFITGKGKNIDKPAGGLGGGVPSTGNGIQSAGSPGDSSPTCENQGGPLAWILCPIFNAVSDASQFIFQNIVQPFLVAQPVSTDPNDPSFQIWSNLRIYGDIFLIIALLAIVFGESIGGGLIDSYTAKKILPRLLVAAILINLSIYLVAFLVDFSNILGKGVGYILTAPLSHCHAGGGNCWDFSLSNGDQARVFSVGLIGLLAGGTAVAGFLGTIIFGGLAGISAVITVAFFVLLPVFFGILAVFITLIVRQGLILMLVLVSPIAFALYCLPNTQRIFRRWWDLLIETLMVYPIIVAIFGVAEILSVTILAANNISPADLNASTTSTAFTGSVGRTLALVVAFLLQFLPLLAVPFAFRFASGALGRVYDLANNAGQQINKLADTRREHAKRDYQAQALSGRGRIYHSARSFGEQHQGPLGIGRRAGRFAGRLAGGYNIEGLLSAGRAEKIKQLEDQIATGRDEEIRGLTVNKTAALRGEGLRKFKDANGDVKYADLKTGAEVSEGQVGQYDYQEALDANGNVTGRQFQSLGGAWVDEQDVDAGYSRWGRDEFAQQAALSYEMRKGITDEQRDRIKSKYFGLATGREGGQGGWGMNPGMAGGSWKGAGFANQGTNLEYKHLNFDEKNGTQKFNRQAFLDEVYEKRGSYDMSRMDAGTIGRLQEAWDQTEPNSQQQAQLRSIAQTMQDRMAQRRGQEVVQGEGGEVQQQASAIGPGHVTEAMDRFVNSALGSGN